MEIKTIRAAGIVAIGSLLAGCASITQGTSQTIVFNLEPKSISCVATREGDGQLGTLTESTNKLLVSKDKDDILVSCNAPEHAPETVRLVSEDDPYAVVGSMFLDFGIVDMITGAMWKYPDTFSITLKATEPAKLTDILVEPLELLESVELSDTIASLEPVEIECFSCADNQ